MSIIGKSERKCGHCGGTGHYRSTCPKIKECKSPISLNPSTEEEILQFSPNKFKSAENEVPVKRVLRPRTRSVTTTQRIEVIENPNDCDFQPSVSDLKEVLESQEVEAWTIIMTLLLIL